MMDISVTLHTQLRFDCCQAVAGVLMEGVNR